MRIYEYNFGGNTIIEEYISGDEFSVEAISLNSKHKILAITRKFINEKSLVEIGHVLPAELGKDEQDKIEKIVTKLLDHIGVKNGPTHTEVKRQGNNVYVIETHLRVGGDKIPLLLKNYSGIDLYNVYSEIISNEYDSVNELVNGDSNILIENRSTAIWFLHQDVEQPEIISSISGVEEATQLVGCVEVNIGKKVGDIIKPVGHSIDRIGYVIFDGHNENEALSRAKNAANLINVKYKSNNDE
ncbi:hypothetical protein XBKQ1_1800002 [Xenorhabdus bovienii str. kraussei Quebec]|uniref:ATP-grasp domain-containing protein n=1 Tax=Xenorhabdus bovienii str. kraussei Quebec TaxID=1398203 RepID=A0A077PGW6_XENBV|nr:ATP-grasp domain-containing protein [Xenorhabdus bovienii]CDH18999.1 hypothetical protein XBKQ1_1800002 [Xenorhabdus bovienii str. kraussei Quebec]